MKGQKVLRLWVAVGPDGTVWLPNSPEANRLSGKRAAIMEARAQRTLDEELRDGSDYFSLLSWDSAYAAGYRVRLGTLTVPA